jgi:glucose-1-phosphate adenylyltransferase
VERSVLLDGVYVGAGAIVRNAILDKNVSVGPGARVGVDTERDRVRDRAVISGNGVVAIGKGQIVAD